MRAIVLDTETTDNNPATNEVIELAYIQLPSDAAGFHPQTQMGDYPSFEKRFCPSGPIKFGAMSTHHILIEDLQGCLPSAGLREMWSDPGDIEYVIGHNIDFDADSLGGMPGVRRICTLALARHLLPDLDSHKLGAVLYFFAVHGEWSETARLMQKEAHSALADVKMCALILNGLMDLAEEKGHTVDTWEQVWQLSQIARIPTIMGFGKYKGLPIKDLDRGYVSWYRRQADTDPYYLEAFKRAGF